MKYIFLIVLLFCLSLSQAQTTIILDANFEQDLVAQGIDTNGLNGNILNSDAQAVTDLTIIRNDITDFTGLEAFINLVTVDLGKNEFLSVPLRTLTFLEALVFDDNNILDSLDLTQNTNLKILNIGTTGSSGNASTIRTLDLSQNVLLETVYIYAFLELDTLIWPQTNTLNKIQVIGIDEDIFDFTNHGGLVDLLLNQNRATTNIILPAEKKVLKKLDIRNQVVSNIDLDNFIALENLSLSGTEVETLILPNNTVLKRLNINRHKLPAIYDLSSVPNIERLTIESNLLTTPFEVNLTALSFLTHLDLSDNKMINLDITQNTILTDLNLERNALPTFNTSQNPLIVNFNANTNKITTLDLANNIALEKLNLSKNLLPVLGLSKNINLVNLNLRTNLLTTLDLNTNIALRSLNLGDNLLPNLDITTNIDLRNLYIDINLFTGTGLDLTQNANLRLLDASFNQIESLNISQNLSLSQLIINNNLFSGNDILNQFYQVFIDSNRKFVWRDKLIVHHNLLTGKIPDFSNLVKNPVAGESFDTYYFYLEFEVNKFHFGDFENEHNDYINFLTTSSPRYGSLQYFKTYTYAPQGKVNAIENPIRNSGDNITFTTTVRGAQNHYTWFKDGVIIPNAPDGPEYTITNLNSCDAGVYHSEIRSDLVPFENTNPPGTNGKNLLLERNNITLIVTTTKECTSLINPADGDTNVPFNTGIEWSVTSGACSYKLLVTNLDTGTIIVNNENVGEDAIYNFASDLPSNTNISVLVTPVFEDGDYTSGCTAETFTTNNTILSPRCTVLSYPVNGAIAVRKDLNVLKWNPANGADGYKITITGNSSTANNITDFDVSAATNYTFPNEFDYGEIVTVIIIPYNTVGDAMGTCSPETFTIAIPPVVPPNCTTLNSPLNGATNISVNSDITWNAVANATGYFISIGTTSGGTEIVNSIDVGNLTTYNPTSDFPDEANIFVTIAPYNSAGNATGCTEEGFLTETLIPNCTILNSPLNGATNISVNSDITWNAVANATGYFISIGTTSGGTEIVNSIDVGNLTTYNPTSDFPDEADIFVTIAPYNSAGNATGCSEENFTTEAVITIPNCTTLLDPLSNSTGVFVESNISWNMVNEASGYILNMGTTPGGNELLNNFDAGNATTYSPPANLPELTTIFVTITPYNSLGSAINCIQERFDTNVGPKVPNCTVLNSPLNNATGIAVSTDLTWNNIADANGYRISIGKTPSGNEILKNQDLGNVTTLNLTDDLPLNSQIFVTIIPYNDIGVALGCTVERFTTVTGASRPNCTTLSSPINGEINVPLDATINWNPVADATGYRITVGSKNGGGELANNMDMGNTTTFTFGPGFIESVVYYVTIVPYNSSGESIGCTEERFTAIPPKKIPNCTTLTNPLNASKNIAVSAIISWRAVADADGYLLRLGTSFGSNNIVNNLNVGNVTLYDLPDDLPQNTEIFVLITPYNSVGNAPFCSEESFTTESFSVIPTCTTLSSPLNGSRNVSTVTNLNWNTVTNADGYLLTVSSASGVNTITNLDVSASNYNFSNAFIEGDAVTVTIIPYNKSGQALGCTSENFTVTKSLSCTSLTSPLNGATNVSRSTNITWTEVANATAYTISIGTASGGSDILTINWSGNTYNLDEDLPENTEIFVTIIPFNILQTATGCIEQSFITEAMATSPDCTSLHIPLEGTSNVLVSSNISWNAVANATGYFISIGTTSGGTDIANTIDVGNLTTYNPVSDFPDEADIFVSITPYNSLGNSIGCSEERFTTEKITIECTTLVSPLKGAANVSVSSDITWNAVANATGYFISIGTTSGGTEIANTIDVGNSTTYKPATGLLAATDVFVTIIPYNAVEDAAGCSEERFSTETKRLIIPKFFTPNADGYNDIWLINDNKNEIKSISIYNRYGKLIRFIVDISVGWDGSISGKKLPTNDYWCVIELYSGEMIKEHFTLKR